MLRMCQFSLTGALCVLLLGFSYSLGQDCWKDCKDWHCGKLNMKTKPCQVYADYMCYYAVGAAAIYSPLPDGGECKKQTIKIDFYTCDTCGELCHYPVVYPQQCFDVDFDSCTYIGGNTQWLCTGY